MTINPEYHPPARRQISGASEVNICVKYILFALNILFWLLGLVMVIVGAYARAMKTYAEIGSALPWFMDPANLFILVGIVIFTLAFLGCLGALRENTILLKIFECVIDFLLLAEIALALYVYFDRARVQKNVEKLLQKTIPKYRDDEDFQSVMDWTQETMKCCGVTNYEDWEGNIYFNCTATSEANPERCGVPYSCCINFEKDLNRQCGYHMREETMDSVRNSKIYTQGCVDAFFKYFLSEDNLVLLSVIAGAVVILQLVTTGLAHNLCSGVRKQRAKWVQPNANRGRTNYVAETTS